MKAPSKMRVQSYKVSCQAENFRRPAIESEHFVRQIKRLPTLQVSNCPMRSGPIAQMRGIQLQVQVLLDVGGFFFGVRLGWALH